MRAMLQIVSAVGIIAGLMIAVAGLFYGFCWALLFVLCFFPVIGKRHRHSHWDELTNRSGRS